ncbi:MAG: bifunctional UDP-N-acetylglucosamine diphosphorylase/glucosamine-1-phosphate N-acetyltransferase GlmU [Nitrospirae bacterium]|nr:bifunctional UDP-N-acetylglucosamine diphosphorylase/glucosamine-1-phosphate N-acetyltransferase GlmU [Nitrospirota bacterium]
MTVYSVILSAGIGKRMKSSTPKVLHEVLGKPIVAYAVDALANCGKVLQTIVVISKRSGLIRQYLEERPEDKPANKPEDKLEGKPANRNLIFAYQEEPLGTADALRAGVEVLPERDFDCVVVMAGDTPLVKSSTLSELIERHAFLKSDLTLTTFIASNPNSYGRIKRGPESAVQCIIEDGDASAEEKKIFEVNSGLYVFGKKALALLREIGKNEKKGEYYLTDIVSLCNAKGLNVNTHVAPNEYEFMGINTRYDMLVAQKALQREIALKWMEEGVTMMDVESIIIHPGVSIGKDTVIYPNVQLEGNTRIGEGCKIYSNVRIVDTELEDRVIINDSTVIDKSKILSGSTIGPFARVRPGSEIGPKARIGNFVEIKNSTIGFNTKASHLTYIGDAILGRDINIGAGTITCNYDGKDKHKTVIKDGVFIGSGSQLVAPVTINGNAFVGAGSTITADVPEKALAISRTKQRNISGWVKPKENETKENETIKNKTGE